MTFVFTVIAHFASQIPEPKGLKCKILLSKNLAELPPQGHASLSSSRVYELLNCGAREEWGAEVTKVVDRSRFGNSLVNGGDQDKPLHFYF